MDFGSIIVVILIFAIIAPIILYSRPVDVGLSMLIVGLLGILILYSEMSVYIMSVDKDWTANRCNPMVMPFVSLVGYDATKNFMQCVKAAESKNMADILRPINDRINGLSDKASLINTSIDNARKDISSMRDNITDEIENIYSVILNILISIQRSLIWIKEVISKMVGILTALSYSMKGGIIVGNNIIEGPIKSLSDKISEATNI